MRLSDRVTGLFSLASAQPRPMAAGSCRRCRASRSAPTCFPGDRHGPRAVRARHRLRDRPFLRGRRRDHPLRRRRGLRRAANFTGCVPCCRRRCCCSTSSSPTWSSFILTAGIIVFVTSTALGAKWKLALPITIFAPIFIHLIFSKLPMCRCRSAFAHAVVRHAQYPQSGLRAHHHLEVIIAMLAASVYGLVIGSLPGLSATMATALLVPVTFYLSPIAAIATIVAASSMAIFSGDIPAQAAAHSRHARVGGLCGRSLCHDAKGRG